MRIFEARFLVLIALGSAALLLGQAAQAGLSTSTARRMMESGKSLMCDYAHEDEYSRQDGTIYFSKGRMRGDFRMSQPGMAPFEGHVIRDKEWQYTWGGPMGEKQGFKMRAMENPEAEARKKGFDLDKELEMDCREWRENSAAFVPPQDVAFQDMTETFQQIQQVTSQLQQIKCQACNQVPEGPQRQQCLQAMGCPAGG